MAFHELTHVRRLDAPVLGLISVVRAVLWFHPLVWLACRQVSELAETACDDAVLEADVEPVEYAGMLTRIAEGLPRRAVSLEIGANMVFSKSKFFRRIETILSDRRGRIKKLTKLALAGTVAAVILSIGLAAALPVGGSEKSEPAKSRPAASTSLYRSLRVSSRYPKTEIHNNMTKTEIAKALARAYRANSIVPSKGAGRARITIHMVNTLKRPTKKSEQQFLAIFKFKGMKFRTERYRLHDGERGELEETQIDTGEESYVYKPGKNAFRGKGGNASHERGQLGYDFTPARLNKSGDRAAILYLEDAIGDVEELRPIFREDGLFEIRILGMHAGDRGESRDWEGQVSYVFDPALDYRLIRSDLRSQVNTDGKTLEYHYRAEYDEEFSSLYPKAVHMIKRMIYPGGESTEIRRTVDITRFDPEAKVTDEDFTFESLDIPPGTRVADAVERRLIIAPDDN